MATNSSNTTCQGRSSLFNLLWIPQNRHNFFILWFALFGSPKTLAFHQTKSKQPEKIDPGGTVRKTLCKNAGYLLMSADISKVYLFCLKCFIKPIKIHPMGSADMSHSLGSLFQNDLYCGFIVFANRQTKAGCGDRFFCFLQEIFVNIDPFGTLMNSDIVRNGVSCLSALVPRRN